MAAHLKAFPRITIDAKQMGGLSCIRGIRIPVARVVEMVAEGMTKAEIIDDYPDLEPEDIKEALKYAAEALRLGVWPTDENCQDD